MDVTHLTSLELLRAHGAILDELRRREIVRSTNSPISDYAEVLFCRAFGWTREGNSASGFDATDAVRRVPRRQQSESKPHGGSKSPT